ncbi:MAG: hypothetical protein DHS20C20_29050 [Ardenticatenaceae bacterium]|nr:MAG: hypothetical protein DHS20C20_29050 [Ardenticatenaceae bacterium]
MNNRQFNLAGARRIVAAVVVIVGILLVLTFAGQFFYVLESVQEQEVGIQFRNNRIYEIVGPGVYSDVGLFVSLETISSQAIPFTVRDEEIITRDKQRIGLVVSGDIFRPDLGQSVLIQEQWAQYRGIYRDDLLASTRVQDLARQSMKVCVGDRTFDNNIIGTSRDELRNCIDEELNTLVSEIGLRIENLVVPEVILSPAVQAALDAIVQSRLETEKAAQDELKAEAEAAAEQARQEGEIRVEQSRIQEQTRQQITLAQLEQERLAAQLVVIEATQNNDLADLVRQQAVLLATKEIELLRAEEDLQIAEILAEVALIQAQADTALQDALALIYAQNPEYVELLIVQANASALTDTDKIIFTPEGTIPTLVLPGPGIVPTVDTTGQTTVPATTESSP